MNYENYVEQCTNWNEDWRDYCIISADGRHIALEWVQRQGSK